MAHRQLTTHHGDQIVEVGAMAHVREKRTILFIDRLPIVSVELWIVEVLALNAPVLTINLLPLGARIDVAFRVGRR